MYAEALNESGQTIPSNTLSAVRSRAELSAIGNIGQTDLRAIISHERRIELNMEGDRWFDLARKDSIVTVISNYLKKYNIGGIGGRTLEAYKVLFPIPLTEIQINPKIIQNPSY